METHDHTESASNPPMPDSAEETGAVVLELDDDEALEPERVGNKAYRLARLRREGFKVPAGLVVTGISPTESGDGKREERAEQIAEVVEPKLDDVGRAPFAVRSSAVGEDGEVESMAGQFRTELNVAFGEVADAVVRCLEATPHLESAADRPPEMAVLIQPMVEAECAGVAFSRDPITGDDVTVVNAVEGLADELVDGTETGEQWGLEDDGIRAPETEKSVLDSERVEAIARCVDEIAELFDGPQDVEWVWSDGEVRIVQTRPITALPVPPPDEPVPEGTWTKDATHYPDGLTPLGESTLALALEEATARAFEKWGLMVERAEQLVYRHEVYMRMVPPGDGGGAPPPAFVLGIVARLMPSMRRRIKTANRAVEEDLAGELIERWKSEERPRFERRTTELREVDRSELSDEEIVDHLDECIELLVDGETVHFLLFPPYAMALCELCQFTEEHLEWSASKTLELMVGLSEETSGPARGLRKLADHIEAVDAAVDVLESSDTDHEAVAGRLGQSDSELETRWNRFVDRWGHRTLGYDPGQPTLAERPGIIRRRLLELVDEDPDKIDELEDRRRALADKSRERLEAKPGLVDRFDELLEEARTVWPIREENVAFTDSMTNGCRYDIGPRNPA